MLKADLCDYSDACITVKGLLAAASNENVKAQKNVAFKNNALFRSCISKVNSTLIVNAEDLDIAMPMYNLLEYSQNYYMTSGSLCNYYRDGGKSFNYKTKIVGKHREYQIYHHNQIHIKMNVNHHDHRNHHYQL